MVEKPCKYIRYLILALALCLNSAFADSNKAFDVLKARNSDNIIAVRPKKPVPVVPTLVPTPPLQSRSSAPNEITYSLAMNDPVLTADGILEALSKDYGLFVKDAKKELRPINAVRDELGYTRVIYKQRFNGIDVLDGDLSIYFNSKNEFSFAKSNLKDNIQVSSSPLINDKIAVDIAKNIKRNSPAFKLERTKYKTLQKKKCNRKAAKPSSRVSCLKKKLWSFDKRKLPTVKNAPKLYVMRGAKKDTLIWQLSVSENEHSEKTIQVDAGSGAVLMEKEDVHFAQPIYRYSTDCGHNINLPENAGNCYANTLTTAYGYEFYFGRSEYHPARGPNPVPGYNNSTDVDFYYEEAMPSIHNFWGDRFGRWGGNGLGGTRNPSIPAMDVLSFFMANANNTPVGLIACNQTVPIAWRTKTGIYFCTGARSHELIGHEYAHIVSAVMALDATEPTGFLSLSTLNESGALNESFSDIMAESYEKFKTGNNNWVFLPESGNLARNMQTPGLTTYHIESSGIDVPYPDRYGSQNFYCGEEESGGIYRNSTIPSKAAYLASEGGQFNGCQVTGIGLAKVEQIWYRALTTYFTQGETFNDAYYSLKQACIDFATNQAPLPVAGLDITITSSDCINLETALQAVEMDQEITCEERAQPGFSTTATCAGIIPPPDPEPTAVPTATPTAAPPPVDADFDNNGVVDLWDYNVFKREFLGFSAGFLSDANNDGVITEEDYIIWKTEYESVLGNSAPPFPATKGDCDGDGDNDAADFLAWQRNYALTGPGLICDLNADGTIDAIDYTVWRDSYRS